MSDADPARLPSPPSDTSRCCAASRSQRPVVADRDGARVPATRRAPLSCFSISRLLQDPMAPIDKQQRFRARGDLGVKSST
jgi:hypothetical protein